MLASILLLSLAACDRGPAEPDWPTDDRDDTGGAEPDPRPVSVAFTGYAATVTGTPFGLSPDALRDQACDGTFTYDLAVPDGLFDDAERGEYDHGDRRTAAFSLSLAGHVIEGSGAAITEVHHAASGDLWRYVDGPQLADDTYREMRIDGTALETVELWVSMSLPDGTFTSDAQPEPFPTIAEVNSLDHPHTFSLDVPEGTVLLQLHTIGPG